MIIPVSINNFYSNQKNNNKAASNNSCSKLKNNLKLSGYNNPMKSYISFGYCEKNGGHYQKMYEIDEKFSQKISEKIKEIEEIKNKPKTRLSLEDESNMQAAKIMMQYSNMQTVFAEMPPAYTIVTGTKLKEEMDKTQTFTNPVSNLITLNNITKINGANNDLPESRRGKATRAAQLYSSLILLDQIKENKTNPKYKETEEDIDEIVEIAKQTIKGIYGDDIFDRVQALSQMGRKVSLENQRMALNFLIEIDCVSKDLKFPDEFEEKLSKLIDKQNDIEKRTIDTEQPDKKTSRIIKVFYPDHEHTLDHINGTPHTHEHHHNQTNEYQKILDNMHEHKTAQTPQIQEQNKEKKLIQGE